ncbi:hypothetical protein ACA910_012756 [Epithemia clementina (nom. ined.)]
MAKPQSKEVMIKLGEDEFCIHTWNINDDKEEEATALVIIYHGMGAHGMYPTVRYAAELFASSTQPSLYKVLAPDMRGHGKSPGLPGYLPSADTVVEDAYQVAKYAITEYQPKKLFLVGSSMGGTIALEVAQKLVVEEEEGATAKTTKDSILAGVILLAPMLKLSVSSLEQSLLSSLASVCPTWRLIPSSSTNAAKQYRDDHKRQECEKDPLVSKSTLLRVGTANTCVSLASRVDQDNTAFLSKVPFWLGVADEDVVVNNQGSLDWYENAPSTTDKTLKRYPALHGLLCEPSPLFDEIAKDILDWTRERC